MEHQEGGQRQRLIHNQSIVTHFDSSCPRDVWSCGEFACSCPGGKELEKITPHPLKKETSEFILSDGCLGEPDCIGSVGHSSVH